MKIQIQTAVERSLKHLDTLYCADTASQMYGCIDRDFWAYRTTRGYSSTPFQHAMSGLAYLSTTSTGPQSQQLCQRAIGALDFWLSSRNRRGSCNEWYRNEQSFCATAMGLNAASETLCVLRDLIKPPELQVRLEDLLVSERWLRIRNNHLASNQQVASCSGRYLLGVLASRKDISARAVKDLWDVIKKFESIGYLPEYGGIDIGYSLLSIDLLAAAHQNGLASCERLVAGLCEQLRAIVGHGTRLPFELGSRGTRHQFYGGLAYFSKVIAEARDLWNSLDEQSLGRQFSDLDYYDDRYFSTFAFSALGRRIGLENSATQVTQSVRQEFNLPPPPIRSRCCLNGVLYEHQDFGYCLSYEQPEGFRLTHLGYQFIEDSGDRWTSLNAPEKTVVGYLFRRVSTAMPLVRHELFFRLLFSVCRVSGVAFFVSLLARTRAGRPSKRTQILLRREVVNTGSALVVQDRIKFRKRTQGNLEALVDFPFHSPSIMSSIENRLMLEKFRFGVRTVTPDSELRITWTLAADLNVQVSEILV